MSRDSGGSRLPLRSVDNSRRSVGVRAAPGDSRSIHQIVLCVTVSFTFLSSVLLSADLPLLLNNQIILVEFESEEEQPLFDILDDSDSAVEDADPSVERTRSDANVMRVGSIDAAGPSARRAEADGASVKPISLPREPNLPPSPEEELFVEGDEEAESTPLIQPPVLRRPLERTFSETDPLVLPAAPWEPSELLAQPIDATLGYASSSGVLPSEPQESSHFVPMDDRWRTGFPKWDRYGKGQPPHEDVPYEFGNILDPYNQNVLKGDYPIIGQHTFLTVTATNLTILEGRQVPTPTSPFESTGGPNQEEFFGDPKQFFVSQNFITSFDLVHGDGAFKPADWRLKITPIFNLNYLDVNELAIVNPNVQAGKTRYRQDFALEEWFAEAKLADTSPYYDFVSVRGGSQFFVSDFRGFVFSDTNRAVRLFGTNFCNRDQFNMILFDQTEKNTNSLLNTFDDRNQNTFIMNYYRQDFLVPGYTTNFSFHYNRDHATTKFDDNGFLVRPDPVGVFQPHRLDAYYLGWAGDGHIDRFNVSNALYWVLGRDQLSPLAGQKVDINALMGAIELSYDRDWARFRASYFFASGDKNINDDHATGFDSIFDNPNFAGGQFSYWQRQTIGLFGVNLKNRMSLVPDLRSSKFQGQSNFVNPGLHLFNLGVDFDLTPKLKSINNVNFLWFDQTQVLERYIFQENVRRRIGADLSAGVEYRPFLNNNAIIVAGISGLIPGPGFDDLYSRAGSGPRGFLASFMQFVLTY